MLATPGRFLSCWSSSCPRCKLLTSPHPCWYPGKEFALVTVILGPFLMGVSPCPVHCAPSNIFIFSDRSCAHVSCLGFCSPFTAEHIFTAKETLLTGKLWATQRLYLPPVGQGNHPPGLYGQHTCSKCPNGGLRCPLRNQACSSNSNSSGQLTADRAQPASSQFCIFTHEDFGSRQDPTAL